MQAGDQSFGGKWLVGCDGSRSVVRKASGFDFVGTEPEFSDPLVGHSAPNFELENGPTLGELLHDGRAILLGFAGNADLKTLASAYGPRLKYVASPAREQLGLRGLDTPGWVCGLGGCPRGPG
jgi:hypothetical protein